MTTNTIDTNNRARWRQLPNGGYIDQILRDVVKYPHVYDLCFYTCLDRVGNQGWDQAIQMATKALYPDRREAWMDLGDWIITIEGTTWQRESARWSTLALTVWDSARQYLDMDLDRVSVEALLGVPVAVLMEPVVFARNVQDLISVDK